VAQATALSLVVVGGMAVRTEAQAPSGPPPTVTVTPVQLQDVTPSAEFIARVVAIQTVNIQARVGGYLQQVEFKEGQDVKAGDLLYVIEPGLYEAALASAQAQLAEAQANERNAQLNYQRNAELLRGNNVSQATVDQALAQRDIASAQVAAAQAAVRTAQINLGYTKITAPINGRIGVTAVTIGNVVGPNSGTLATIVQLDPIRIVYSVNQRDLVTFREKNPDATQDELNARFVPGLRLPDGSMYGETGRIEFISNTVDPATGTIAVYANFPNPQALILPGMVATAVIRPEQPRRVLTVPITAVEQDQQGRYVLTVDQGGHVVQRRVQLGNQVQQSWTVSSGLQEGENVIVSGLQKIRPGEVVNAVPASSAGASQ
jgi:membrane fusion protein (multidrug efflux system)